MKRILSVLTSLSLAFCMIPAAFANACQRCNERRNYFGAAYHADRFH